MEIVPVRPTISIKFQEGMYTESCSAYLIFILINLVQPELFLT
jgi:hypothetical protein